MYTNYYLLNRVSLVLGTITNYKLHLNPLQTKYRARIREALIIHVELFSRRCKFYCIIKKRVEEKNGNDTLLLYSCSYIASSLFEIIKIRNICEFHFVHCFWQYAIYIHTKRCTHVYVYVYTVPPLYLHNPSFHFTIFI